MCQSSKAEKIDLNKEKFQPIQLKLGKEEIKFDEKLNKWNPFIRANPSINSNLKKSKNVHNQEDIEKLQKEIEEKDQKISELQTKIESVEKKMATLKNILKIDVGEQMYLQDLLKDKKKENEQ